LMTNMIGKAMMPGSEELEPETLKLFGTVLDSLFTLFGLMNSQFWVDVQPIFIVMPWMKPLWVIFTILSSWALLSVMTGVVSDNMLEVRQLQERKDEEKAHKLRQNAAQSLSEVFSAASPDSANMGKKEYVEIISSPYYLRKLQEIANVPNQDLVRMFDWLDVDQQGSISYDDFMSGFDWLNEAVTGKSLLKLQTSVRYRCKKIESKVKALREDMSHADEAMDKRKQDLDDVLDEILRRLDVETQKFRQERENAEEQAEELQLQIRHSAPRVANAQREASDRAYEQSQNTAAGNANSPSKRRPFVPDFNTSAFSSVAKTLRSNFGINR